MVKQLSLLVAFMASTAHADPDPSANPLKVSQLLQKVQHSQQMQGSKELAMYANDLEFHLPLVKELGMRFGADEFSDASLRYGLAFSFHSPEARRLQRLTDKAIGEYYAAKQEATFNEAISESYRQIAALHTDGLLVGKLTQLDSLLQLQNLALRTSLEMGIPVGAKTLVAAEDDLRDAQLSIQELTNQAIFLRQQLSPLNAGNEDFTLEANGFIPVEKIGAMLKSLERNPWANQQTPWILEAQGQQKLAELEFKSQQAADRQLLDGFQVIHQVNGDPLLGGALSFRFGVNIPLSGGDVSKQNKLRLEMKEAENELEQISVTQKTVVKQQMLKVGALLSRNAVLVDLLEKCLVKKVLGTPTLLATLPATELVELRIVLCKKEIEILENYSELLQEYINLMELTGELVKMPLRNYLSEGLELL